jgi:hypothetical protein
LICAGQEVKRVLFLVVLVMPVATWAADLPVVPQSIERPNFTDNFAVFGADRTLVAMDRDILHRDAGLLLA